ncbi:hypothetical protein BH10PAT1_BH10PAT1_1940 [soil metagenome]
MKKKRAPTAVTTAILTLITIFFWVGFEVYHSIIAKPAPPVAAEIINPLDPTLDTKSLDEIKNRQFLDENTLNTIPTIAPIIVETPLPSPTPVETASASATPTETPSPSPSSLP